MADFKILWDAPFKQALLERVRNELKNSLAVLLRSSEEARAGATHPEAKQEGKYDTRGIEAGYLAHGQAQRAEEIQRQLDQLLQINLLGDFEKLRPGSLAEAQVNDQKHTYFLLPFVGGLSFDVESQKIQLVSIASPLGQELLGREKGDEFEFKGKSYELIKLG